MESALIDRLVAHCQKARFTGILRMRAREGIGEVWFLSGMVDEVHFGVSEGDEAMDRMRKANDATFELVARLPHPGGGFKKTFPAKGSITTATPVTLMRYCERYALTCTLAVESGGVLVEARYELGELVSVETTADDDGITKMLEAQDGTYEFTLPRVELPEGTPVLPPAPSLLESMPPPESVGLRALLEAKPAVGRPPSDEAEVKRKTVEIAQRQKKSATTPTATVPRPVAAPKAERKTPKPAAAAPADEKREAEKREAEKREAEKREAEKREAEKREAEKREAEKREAERLAAIEAEKPAEPAPASAEPEPESEPEPEPEPDSEPEPEAAEVPPPAMTKKGSWTWLVVSLVVVAVLGYLLWAHKI